MKKKIVRYSDLELVEFQALIETKIEKATVQLMSLKEQLNDLNENDDNNYDPDDNSSSFVDREFLQKMVHRQEKHIRDLENALVRIKNKTFGVCGVTGELIDKKRLMAVPTTTKSLAAKLNPVKPVKQERPKLDKPKEKVILTKILKKTSTPNSIIDNQSIDQGQELQEEKEDNDDWEFIPFDEEMEGFD